MSGLHDSSRVTVSGAPVDDARAAMILVHGRGATAESILKLATEFERPGVAYFAPQATGNGWYPYSFLAPLEQNEPGLSSGLRVIDDLLGRLGESGVPPDRTVLLGFSQGACLTLEFAARNARRYGGVVGLSGGLIGPDGTPRDYPGSLEATPVFLGCSDIDPHVPLARLRESARVFRELGAEVTERVYPGMGHTVNEDELEFVRGLLGSALERASPGLRQPEGETDG